MVCLQWDFREWWILAMCIFRECWILPAHATRFSGGAGLQPGGYIEMSSIFADQQRPRIHVPVRGYGGWVAGLQAMSTAVHIR
jgi:hypothetical protein